MTHPKNSQRLVVETMQRFTKTHVLFSSVGFKEKASEMKMQKPTKIMDITEKARVAVTAPSQSFRLSDDVSPVKSQLKQEFVFGGWQTCQMP